MAHKWGALLPLPDLASINNNIKFAALALDIELSESNQSMRLSIPSSAGNLRQTHP